MHYSYEMGSKILLSFVRAGSRNSAHNGLGKGPLYLENVRCTAGAKSLEQCTYTRWEQSRYCSMSSKFEILCTPIGKMLLQGLCFWDVMYFHK